MASLRAACIRVSILLVLAWHTGPVKAMSTGVAFALPKATAGTNYQFTLRAEGGQPPFKWSLVEGELPPGMELQSSGALRGTPTVPRALAFEFTLQVSDSSEPPLTDAHRFALVVAPAPLRIVMNREAPKIIQPDLSGRSQKTSDMALPGHGSRAENNGDQPATNRISANTRDNRKPAADLAATKSSNGSGDEIKVCGKIRPASLDRVFSLISNVPELRDLIRGINGGRLSDDGGCKEPDKGYKPGTQKEREVRLLEFVLAAVRDKSYKASTPDLNTAIENLSKEVSTVSGGGHETLSAKNVVGHLKSMTQDGFDRLSERTLIREIEFLNGDIGNIQVRLSQADKVVATGFTDKDGNYLIKVPKTNHDSLAKAGRSEETGNAASRGVKNSESLAAKKSGGTANNGIRNHNSSTSGTAGNVRSLNPQVNNGNDNSSDDTDANNGASGTSDNTGTTGNNDTQKEDAKAKDEQFVISTELDDYGTERSFVAGDEDIRIDIPIEDRPISSITRAVVGYQQAAAASSDFEQNVFFDLFLRNSLPVRQKVDPDFGERFQLWGAIRVASVPQSGDVKIGETISGTGSNSFIAKIKDLRLNEVARVFDLMSGIEIRLMGNSALLPSFARDTKQKFSLSLIGSYGFTTPKTPAQSIDPLLHRKFEISDELRKRLPDLPAEKKFVAFVDSDRDRFFNQVYGGLRVQTFFFNRHNIPIQRFPAQLDIQFGLNSYVTGGRLKQCVFRLDGYYPLPYEKVNFISLFGTAIIRPAHPKIEKPLILKERPDLEVPGPEVEIVPVAQFNRDYYRVGVGIDFISLIKKIMGN
jgi:hypothetical protein